MSTGERMKTRRKQLGYSADYVAEKLNVSRSTVFRYEGGDIEKLPIDIIEPLSQILKTTPAFLMGWDEVSEDELPTLTKHELDIVKKYNKLDSRGKHTVNTVLDMEYNRVNKPHLEVVAAHNDDHSEEQIRLMREDLDDL